MTETPRHCPICNKPEDRAHRPFCSVRCQQLDLGNWLDERYALPAEDEDDERPTIPVQTGLQDQD